MLLGDLLTQAGGQNLGDPERGLKEYDEAVAILSALVETPDASLETQKLYADAIVSRAYIRGFHFDVTSSYAETLDIVEPIYERVLSEDPNNIDAKATLLNLRFARWQMNAIGNQNFRIDDELLSIKSEIEALFADDLSERSYAITYGGFLFSAVATIVQKWDAPYGILEMHDREEYLTLREWITTSIELSKQYYENEPSNPEAMYLYLWRLELYLPYESGGLTWRPSLFDLEDRLGQKYGTDAELHNSIQRHPDFQNMLALSEQMESHLATADEILSRLKPFDGNTFSYLHLVFVSHQVRAQVYGGLSFDFTEAEANYMAAISIVEPFNPYATTNINYRLEAISMRTELAFLLKQKDKILVGNNKDKICTLLEESHQLAFSDNFSFSAEQVAFYNLDTIAPEQESNNCDG